MAAATNNAATTPSTAKPCQEWLHCSCWLQLVLPLSGCGEPPRPDFGYRGPQSQAGPRLCRDLPLSKQPHSLGLHLHCARVLG